MLQVQVSITHVIYLYVFFFDFLCVNGVYYLYVEIHRAHLF